MKLTHFAVEELPAAASRLVEELELLARFLAAREPECPAWSLVLQLEAQTLARRECHWAVKSEEQSELAVRASAPELEPGRPSAHDS